MKKIIQTFLLAMAVSAILSCTRLSIAPEKKSLVVITIDTDFPVSDTLKCVAVGPGGTVVYYEPILLKGRKSVEWYLDADVSKKTDGGKVIVEMQVSGITIRGFVPEFKAGNTYLIPVIAKGAEAR